MSLQNQGCLPLVYGHLKCKCCVDTYFSVCVIAPWHDRQLCVMPALSMTVCIESECVCLGWGYRDVNTFIPFLYHTGVYSITGSAYKGRYFFPNVFIYRGQILCCNLEV